MELNALMAAAAERSPMPFTEVRQPNRHIVAHIDGDYAAYFCSGGDDMEPGTARSVVIDRVRHVKHITGAERVVMHLTAHDSTKGDRFLVAESQPYQGQRNTGRKPRNWQFLREFMETYDGEHFEPKLWTTREADDGIAHVCHAVAQQKNILHVVHTADKDMRMFAGTHCAWKDYQLTDVPLGTYDLIGKDGKQYGHKWFWMQMLMGDAADHIPGLPKVGEVGAAKLLAGTRSNAEALGVVTGKYRELLGDRYLRYFAEQAVLLWMRTDRDANLLNVCTLGCFGPRHVAAFNELATRVAADRRKLEALNG